MFARLLGIRCEGAGLGAVVLGNAAVLEAAFFEQTHDTAISNLLVSQLLHTSFPSTPPSDNHWPRAICYMGKHPLCMRCRALLRMRHQTAGQGRSTYTMQKKYSAQIRSVVHPNLSAAQGCRMPARPPHLMR